MQRICTLEIFKQSCNIVQHDFSILSYSAEIFRIVMVRVPFKDFGNEEIFPLRAFGKEEIVKRESGKKGNIFLGNIVFFWYKTPTFLEQIVV